MIEKMSRRTPPGFNSHSVANFSAESFRLLCQEPLFVQALDEPSELQFSFDPDRSLPRKTIVRLVLPWSFQLSKFNWRQLVASCFEDLPLASRIAWTAKPNIFRRTYMFNFPKSYCMFTCSTAAEFHFD